MRAKISQRTKLRNYNERHALLLFIFKNDFKEVQIQQCYKPVRGKAEGAHEEIIC